MTKTHTDADRGGIPTTGALEQGHRKGGQATDDAPVAHEASRPPSRFLVALGAAGPVLFFAVATLLGLLRPGYDATSRPVSELALGPFGWIQTTSFYATGLCFVAFAFGFAVVFSRRLPRRSLVARVLIGMVSVLIAISGAGLLMAGAFPTDPLGGPQTETGALHDLAFLVAFLPLILAYPLAALALHKVAGWGRYALATALIPVAVFGLMFVFVAFASDPGDPLYAIGGLIQRALIAVAFGWITMTGWRLLRRTPRGEAVRRSDTVI